MNRCYLKFSKSMIVCIFSIILTACVGDSVRTADGNCYYRGKGLLGIGATLLDGAVSLADAMVEQEYQKDQIVLQQLSKQLDSIDVDVLQSNEQVETYNQYVDEKNRLIEKIKDHQDRKQKELKGGSKKSLSQMVDESGECN